MTTRIAGVVKLNNLPAKRVVTALSIDGSLVATGFSDESTGFFDLDTTPETKALTVIVTDDAGSEFTENTEYELDDIAHPISYAGIAYKCTTAGNSGSPLPTEWPLTGTVTVGTAEFTAFSINQPQVYSPVKPQVVE